jgi:O-antigen/teichoic acid export membrane protein
MLNLKIYLKNSALQFIFSRYLVFIISFFRATGFAYFLGPYYYGIWGFVFLYRKYLSFTNLGIPVSFNYFISINKSLEERNRYFTNSLMAILFMTIPIAMFLFSLLFVNLNKHIDHFNSFTALLAIFIVLNNISLLFNNLFRNLGNLNQVMKYQLMSELIILPALLISNKEMIIYAVLLLMILNEILYLFNSYRHNPLKFIRHYVNLKLIKSIIFKGLTILLFTSIVSLLYISTRTIIGYFFPIKTMGIYTFSESLAIVAITAFDTIIWIVLPKLFYKLRKDADNTEVLSVIKIIRSIYTPILFSVVFILISIFPVFLFFFKDYKESFLPFIFILISRGLTSNGLGYSMLSVTRDIEYKAFTAGIVAILINILLSSLLIHYDYQFYSVAFVMILSALFYTVSIISIGMRSINLKMNIIEILNECLPLKIAIPITATVVVNSLHFHVILMNLIILLLFLVLNYRNLWGAFLKINIFIKSNSFNAKN